VANTDPSDVPTRTAVLEHRANATDRALEILHRDFADLRHEMNQRFDQMNHRLDQMNDRLDRHLRWIITTVITTAFAIVGANVGILTLLLRGR
jgi:hypothetical protein